MDLVKDFKFIKPLSWQQVFNIWGQHEANDPGWIRLYQGRGYQSWLEWRQNYVDQLQIEKLNWKLYQVVDPEKSVPKFHGGPFRVWVQYYRGKTSKSFSELIKNKKVIKIPRLQKMLKKFPTSITLIGVQVKNGNVIIVDGTHRCLATTYLVNKNKIKNLKVKIALAKTNRKVLPPIKKDKYQK